ncbi:MAG: hypothetical protein JWO36_3513 [Myxococcales bacterium]|nr:hypothetical protein [Myxococcales bacterium]
MRVRSCLSTATAATAAIATAAASTAVAATTTAAAPATTTTAVTTTTAAATTTTTAAAAAASLFSDVDAQRAAFEILTIEVGDRFLSTFGCRHLDEAETAGLTADAIEHEVDRGDLATRSEALLDQVLGGVERKVADIQAIRHCVFLSDAPKVSRPLEPTGANVRPHRARATDVAPLPGHSKWHDRGDTVEVT